MKTLFIASTRNGTISEFGHFIPWNHISEWTEFLKKRKEIILPVDYSQDFILPDDIDEIYQFKTDMNLSDGPRFIFKTDDFTQVSHAHMRFKFPHNAVPRNSWLARIQGGLYFSGQIIHWLKKKQ